MKKAPIISFVTPSFNRTESIARCIESIPINVRDKVEHIIVDGQSTDGTIDVIKGYPHVRLICEPDDGLYDALNKGVMAAQGRYIGYLATDDVLDREFFNKVSWGDVENEASDVLGFGFSIIHGVEKKFCAPSVFDIEGVFRGAAPIFSILIRRDLFSKIGLYDVRFKIASDMDFLLRLEAVRPTYKAFDFALYKFIRHEASLTGHSGVARFREYEDVIMIIEENRKRTSSKKEYNALAKERIGGIVEYFMEHHLLFRAGRSRVLRREVVRYVLRKYAKTYSEKVRRRIVRIWRGI